MSERVHDNSVPELQKKYLWLFYYFIGDSVRQHKMVVFDATYQDALETIKAKLRQSYGGKGYKLVRKGEHPRHVKFENFAHANAQLGPGMSIMTCLPPHQVLSFLQYYTEEMENEKEKRNLRRGERDMLAEVRARLAEKKTEERNREAQMEREAFKGLSRRKTRGKETRGIATAESERVSDVNRDW